MKNKKYTIRQAIDVASKYTYKNRLFGFIGYGDSNELKENLSSYDIGKKKDYVVTKRKIDGKNHMVVTDINDHKDILLYPTNWKYRKR